MVQPEFGGKNARDGSHQIDLSARANTEMLREDYNGRQTQPWHRKALGALAMGAAASGVLFLQTPANEAIRSNVAFDVFKNTGDGNLAALSVVGTTAAIETAATTAIALGINYKKEEFDGLMHRLRRKKDIDDLEDDNPKINSVGSRAIDLGIMTAVGPGMVIPRRHFQERNRSFRKDMKTGLGYVAVGSALSGAIGWLIFGGVQHADKVGLRRPAEIFAEHAADWKTYAVIGAGYYAVKGAYNGVKHVAGKIKNKTQKDLDK